VRATAALLVAAPRRSQGSLPADPGATGRAIHLPPITPTLSYLDYGPHAVSTVYKIVMLAARGAGIYIGVTRHLPEISFLSSLSLLILIGMEAYDWLLPKLPAYQFFLIMSALAIGALYVLNVLRGRVTERAAGKSQ
jgi:hypothetical protein